MTDEKAAADLRRMLTIVDPAFHPRIAAFAHRRALLGDDRSPRAVADFCGISEAALLEATQVLAAVDPLPPLEARIDQVAQDDATRAILRWALEVTRQRYRPGFSVDEAQFYERFGGASSKQRARVRIGERTLVVSYPSAPASAILLFDVFVAQATRVDERVDVVYDLGANIGTSALFMAAASPGAKVVAVEPVAFNVEYLRENLEQNAIDHVIHEAVVSNINGSVTLTVKSNEHHWAHTMFSSLAGANSVEVPSLALDRIVAPGAASYGIKIDIEGAEHLLCEHASVFANARWVVGELHAGPSFGDRTFMDMLRASFEVRCLPPSYGYHWMSFDFVAVKKSR